MVRAFWVTAGKILANYCHVYGKMMQPTPVGTSHTLLTHTPQSTLPASSHVSTIHTGVPSQPHPHSHTHHYRILHAHASAPNCHASRSRLQNPHVSHSHGLRHFNFLTVTSHAHSRGRTRHSFPVTFAHTQQGPQCPPRARAPLA